MAKRPDQGTRQRRFTRTQVAFEKNHQSRLHGLRQRRPQSLGRRLVWQIDEQPGGSNGRISGKMRRMHDQNSLLDGAALKLRIRELGKTLGFAEVGVSRAEPGPAIAHLQAWLAAGMHGEMDYMARHAQLRAQPQELHPGTVTVICAAIDYLPHRKHVTDPAQAAISRYAQGRDYHKVVRSRLQKLADAISELAGPFGYRVFSDSAPVMEVEFATQAGLGWRGKHSLLLSQRGSWRFLGTIYCDLPLPPDSPMSDHCGSCTRCISACPTAAIVRPYVVDARRCISYLTIELAGAIPEEFRPLIGNRIYGCDDCQLCCPWNRFAHLGDSAFAPRHGLDTASLSTLLGWTEAQFDERLAGNPIRRIGFERWLRNIAVALGNGPASAETHAALSARADHPSALVREHVGWARQRLHSRAAPEDAARPA